MVNRTTLPIEIEQDFEDDIFIRQISGDNLDVIVMSPETAFKLAYKLMSFAAGQGPREGASGGDARSACSDAYLSELRLIALSPL